MAIGVASCSACSIFYTIVRVGPNIRVRLMDRGQPAVGVQVKLTRDRSNVWSSALTDESGSVLFRNLTPGDYGVGPDLDAGIADGRGLHVEADGPTETTITLKWPKTAPVSVRSVKGQMHLTDFLPGDIQPVLSLDLLDARSGGKLKSTETNGRGEFDFEVETPGLYFLSVKHGQANRQLGEFAGMIPIDIDPAASVDRLDLDLGATSCGLFAIDRNQCTQTDLQIQHLSGSIADVAGASIAMADVLLLDSAGKIVERLTSDNQGSFASPRPLDGTYQLIVTSPGFSPLHATVQGKSDGGRLTVQLGVMGTCSTAKQELR